MKTVFKIGDMFMGTAVYRFGDSTWMHVYEVLDVENAIRFDKPVQLLTVKITTTHGTIVDHKVKRWPDQLL